MKFAIPTRGTEVDSHFGHCEMYTIVSSDDNIAISNIENLPSPQGCGCKSNIAVVFQQIGVDVMLAGGIGEGAINVLRSHGVRVIRGCSGNVKTIAEHFLKGELLDSGRSCSNHEHPHGEDQSCKQ
jgi:predicted Fe-Mo cluster-binding NifX family protein